MSELPYARRRKLIKEVLVGIMTEREKEIERSKSNKYLLLKIPALEMRTREALSELPPDKREITKDDCIAAVNSINEDKSISHFVVYNVSERTFYIDRYPDSKKK